MALIYHNKSGHVLAISTLKIICSDATDVVTIPQVMISFPELRYSAFCQ